MVVLCTSILSTEAVLRTLPIQRLKRNTLFVDVLSVKEFPRNLFLQVLCCSSVDWGNSNWLSKNLCPVSLFVARSKYLQILFFVFFCPKEALSLNSFSNRLFSMKCFFQLCPATEIMNE